MTHKAVCLILKIVLLFSLVGMIFLLLKIPPYQNQDPELKNEYVIVIFFTIFFVFFFALFSLVLFGVRKIIASRGKKQIRNKTICLTMGISIRQGFFLALGITILLVLQTFRILTWWDGLLALGAIFMLELYFLSK